MSTIPSLVSSCLNFIYNNKLLTLTSLGIAAYALWNFAGRAISWISESLGTTHKTNEVGLVSISTHGKHAKIDEPVIGQSSASPHNPLKLVNLTKIGNLNHIPVLNQTYRPGGDVECGFHALKNAFVGAALGLGLPNITQQDFEKPETFLEVFDWISKHRQTKDVGALTLIEINNALLALASANKEMLSPILQIFQTLVKENVILLINYSQFFINGKEEIGFNVGAYTLAYLTNLKALAHKAGPWTYAIAIGGQLSDGEIPHWSTLIVQKDQSGSIQWYGTDSWNNQSRYFKIRLKMIEDVLNDSNSKEWWKVMYENATGNWFSRKSKWINDQGDVPNFDNQKALLDNKTRGDYVYRIMVAFDFMKRGGWLEKNQAAHHQEEITALRKFLVCFQKAEERDDITGLAIKLREMRLEVEQCLKPV